MPPKAEWLRVGQFGKRPRGGEPGNSAGFKNSGIAGEGIRALSPQKRCRSIKLRPPLKVMRFSSSYCGALFAADCSAGFALAESLLWPATFGCAGFFPFL